MYNRIYFTLQSTRLAACHVSGRTQVKRFRPGVSDHNNTSNALISIHKTDPSLSTPPNRVQNRINEVIPVRMVN